MSFINCFLFYILHTHARTTTICGQTEMQKHTNERCIHMYRGTNTPTQIGYKLMHAYTTAYCRLHSRE